MFNVSFLNDLGAVAVKDTLAEVKQYNRSRERPSVELETLLSYVPSYIANNEIEKAQSSVDNYLKRNPYCTKGLLLRAEVLEHLNDMKNATLTYWGAIFLLPTNKTILRRLLESERVLLNHVCELPLSFQEDIFRAINSYSISRRVLKDEKDLYNFFFKDWLYNYQFLPPPAVDPEGDEDSDADSVKLDGRVLEERDVYAFLEDKLIPTDDLDDFPPERPGDEMKTGELVFDKKNPLYTNNVPKPPYTNNEIVKYEDEPPFNVIAKKDISNVGEIVCLDTLLAIAPCFSDDGIPLVPLCCLHCLKKIATVNLSSNYYSCPRLPHSCPFIFCSFECMVRNVQTHECECEKISALIIVARETGLSLSFILLVFRILTKGFLQINLTRLTEAHKVHQLKDYSGLYAKQSPELYHNVIGFADRLSDLISLKHRLYMPKSELVIFILKIHAHTIDIHNTHNVNNHIGSINCMKTVVMGQGLSILLSAFEHSCTPSCALSYNEQNTSIIVKTICKHRQDQPMTLSWISDLALPTHLRKTLFNIGKVIACRCIRCLDGTDGGLFLRGQRCRVCVQGFRYPSNPNYLQHHNSPSKRLTNKFHDSGLPPIYLFDANNLVSAEEILEEKKILTEKVEEKPPPVEKKTPPVKMWKTIKKGQPREPPKVETAPKLPDPIEIEPKKPENLQYPEYCKADDWRHMQNIINNILNEPTIHSSPTDTCGKSDTQNGEKLNTKSKDSGTSSTSLKKTESDQVAKSSDLKSMPLSTATSRASSGSPEVKGDIRLERETRSIEKARKMLYDIRKARWEKSSDPKFRTNENYHTSLHDKLCHKHHDHEYDARLYHTINSRWRCTYCGYLADEESEICKEVENEVLHFYKYGITLYENGQHQKSRDMLTMMVQQYGPLLHYNHFIVYNCNFFLGALYKRNPKKSIRHALIYHRRALITSEYILPRVHPDKICLFISFAYIIIQASNLTKVCARGQGLDPKLYMDPIYSAAYNALILYGADSPCFLNILTQVRSYASLIPLATPPNSERIITHNDAQALRFVREITQCKSMSIKDVKALLNTDPASLAFAAAKAGLTSTLSTSCMYLYKKFEDTIELSSGFSLMSIAAAYGHPNVVKMMLECKMDLFIHNEWNVTPLLAMCMAPMTGVPVNTHRHKSFRLFGFQIDQRDEAQATILRHMVKHIHSRAKNAAGMKNMSKKCQNRLYREHVRLLKQNFLYARTQKYLGANYALHYAAARNKHLLAYQLVQVGFSIDTLNREGSTALMIACFCGHRETVETLLHLKANPNISNLSGETPLMAAAYSRHVGILKLLFDHGADVSDPLYTISATKIEALSRRGLDSATPKPKLLGVVAKSRRNGVAHNSISTDPNDAHIVGADLQTTEGKKCEKETDKDEKNEGKIIEVDGMTTEKINLLDHEPETQPKPKYVNGKDLNVLHCLVVGMTCVHDVYYGKPGDHGLDKEISLLYKLAYGSSVGSTKMEDYIIPDWNKTFSNSVSDAFCSSLYVDPTIYTLSHDSTVYDDNIFKTYNVKSDNGNPSLNPCKKDIFLFPYNMLNRITEAIKVAEFIIPRCPASYRQHICKAGYTPQSLLNHLWQRFWVLKKDVDRHSDLRVQLLANEQKMEHEALWTQINQLVQRLIFLLQPKSKAHRIEYN